MRKIKETLKGEVSTKSLDDILETLRGPENLCNDIKIVINDDDDDDTIIIMSDDDDDDDNDEFKSSCFMFFSEFHESNVLNISRLNFESMKFCLSTNVELATWLNRKWVNTTLHFDYKKNKTNNEYNTYKPFFPFLFSLDKPTNNFTLYCLSVHEGIEIDVAFHDHYEFLEFRRKTKDISMAIQNKTIAPNHFTKKIVIEERMLINERPFLPLIIKKNGNVFTDEENLMLNSALRIHVDNFLSFFYIEKNG